MAKRRGGTTPKKKTDGAQDFRFEFTRELPDKADAQTLQNAVTNHCLPCSWCGSTQLYQELRWPTSFICATCYQEAGAKRLAQGEAQLVTSSKKLQIVWPNQFTGIALCLDAFRSDLEKEELAQKIGPVEDEFSLVELEKKFVGKGEYIEVPVKAKKKVPRPV